MHERRVQALKEQVDAALAERRGLVVRGAGTRAIRGPVRPAASIPAESLAVSALTGVLSWEPEELVVSVAAGTPLAELEATLAEGRQRLLGEPWLPSTDATVGGAVATGLSGPGRPWLGSVSDGVLGVRLLTAPGGRCVDGRFGGRVIKNVAGFDVSRLQVGACGVFGALLEVHLRVAPVPAHRTCLVADTGTREGMERLRSLEPPAWPITGAVLEQGRLHLRLEGERAVVEAARSALASGFREEDPAWWQRLRAGCVPFDASGGVSGDAPGDARPEARVWRICVPRGSPPLPLAGHCVIDWGGALQWWRVAEGVSDTHVLERARAARGFAQPFPAAPFAFLPEDTLARQRAIAGALDPLCCFNRGLLGQAAVTEAS